MDSNSLIKLFEFFKSIPQRLLWVMFILPFGIKLLKLDKNFNNFLNEYTFIEYTTWLTSLFSLLYLCSLYIESGKNHFKHQKDLAKQKKEEELKEVELKTKKKRIEDKQKILAENQVRLQERENRIKKEQKDNKYLRMILDLSNQAKTYLIIDYLNDHNEEQWLNGRSEPSKLECYRNELAKHKLVLHLKDKRDSNWVLSALFRISPATISFLSEDESRLRQIFKSLPYEYQTKVIKNSSGNSILLKQ